MFGRRRNSTADAVRTPPDLRDKAARDRFIFGDGDRNPPERSVGEFLLFAVGMGLGGR
ncbi:MAG TPA: hypothetical protein VHA07_14810 [Devosia sp.]|nr:hypothetical protein [Devosia sp.]